jgi:hypothetical protein
MNPCCLQAIYAVEDILGASRAIDRFEGGLPGSRRMTPFNRADIRQSDEGRGNEGEEGGGKSLQDTFHDRISLVMRFRKRSDGPQVHQLDLFIGASVIGTVYGVYNPFE